MLANSGRVSFEEVLKSLIDRENPAKKFYKSVLANARVDYILPIIHSVMANRIPTFETSERITAI